MNSFLNYLIENTICLLLFALAYRLLISKQTHFVLTRYYLLTSICLCFFLPLIIIPLRFNSSLLSIAPFNRTFLLMGDQIDTISGNNLINNDALQSSGINWRMVIINIILVSYFIGIFYKTFLFICKLRIIYHSIKQNRKQKEGKYHIVSIKNKMPPFSFLNYIFINKDHLNLSQKDLMKVKEHEFIHVKQHHTIDILFFELASIILWFNPLINYLKKAIQEVHEYIVDEKLAGKGEQRKAYAYLLINLASETKTLNLSTNFSGKQLKNRIDMITKTKSSGMQKIAFLIIVPITMALLLSFSYLENPNQHSQKKIRQQDKHQLTSENRIGEINWVGNTVFSADTLNKLLGLKSGDYFSYDDLKKRLLEGDVPTRYFDNGHVFFKADFATSINPNREYDITITIYEGEKANIGIISIKGNIKVPSNEILEKVIIRSGDLFNKTKIVNSIRAIAATGMFVPDEIDITPIPNEETRKIDLVFYVKEK